MDVKKLFGRRRKIGCKIKMERIRIKWNRLLQNFMNRFEIVTTDFFWNDAAICHVFRKKITTEILNSIQQGRKNLPKTFVVFKKITQRPKYYIEIGKKNRENRREAEFIKTKKFVSQMIKTVPF